MPKYLQIFEDQREQLQKFPNEALGQMLRGMLAYNFDGVQIQMSTVAQWGWTAIRQQLDKNLASLKGKAAGGTASAETRSTDSYPHSFPQLTEIQQTLTDRQQTSTDCQQTSTDCQQTTNRRSTQTSRTRTERQQTSTDGQHGANYNMNHVSYNIIHNTNNNNQTTTTTTTDHAQEDMVEIWQCAEMAGFTMTEAVKNTLANYTRKHGYAIMIHAINACSEHSKATTAYLYGVIQNMVKNGTRDAAYANDTGLTADQKKLLSEMQEAGA